MKSLVGKTVVITGASSGIGKAIALTCAKEGANLVLAARRDSVLQTAASECETLGGNAIAVRTDVTDFDDIQRLLVKAIEHYGHIDVWINNAGVGAVGEFTETPLDVHHQVINTNLLGPINGLYAVLPYFKTRGKGTVINTISVGSYVPSALATAYSASKFGLRGLTEALKGELSGHQNIHICDVHPSFIDTPGIYHMANFTGHEVGPVPPLYDPFQVADRVLKLIHHPRPSLMVGLQGRLGRFAHAIAPNLLEKSMYVSAMAALKRVPSALFTHGNLFSPVASGTTARGGKMYRPSILKAWFSKRLALDKVGES